MFYIINTWIKCLKSHGIDLFVFPTNRCLIFQKRCLLQSINFTSSTVFLIPLSPHYSIKANHNHHCSNYAGEDKKNRQVSLWSSFWSDIFFSAALNVLWLMRVWDQMKSPGESRFFSINKFWACMFAQVSWSSCNSQTF